MTNKMIICSIILILAVCFHNWLGFTMGYLVGKLAKMNESKKRYVNKKLIFTKLYNR